MKYGYSIPHAPGMEYSATFTPFMSQIYYSAFGACGYIRYSLYSSNLYLHIYIYMYIYIYILVPRDMCEGVSTYILLINRCLLELDKIFTNGIWVQYVMVIVISYAFFIWTV